MGGKQRQSERWRRRVAESRQATADAPARGFRTADEQAGDRRVAEAMTVAWMLSLTATVVAEAGALIGWLLLAMLGGAERSPALVGMIPGVLFFVALVTGSCCLALGWLVLRLRDIPPPPALRRASVVVGVLPWVFLLGLLLWQSAA